MESLVPAHGLSSLHLAGGSLAMQRVRAQVQRIAPYFRIALITGEAGTGKEIVARVLHARSAGASGPFVIWQATKFVERLGADPDGAVLDEVFTATQGGTLFLHALQHVTYAQQPLLLQLLQQLGTRPHDLRIVAATTQELRPLVATGQFREDLYQHVAAVEIGMVPLRERTGDIAELAATLLRQVGVSAITAEAISHLQLYSWPGNIQELREIVETAAASTDGCVLGAKHFSLPKHTASNVTDNMERLEDVVKRHVFAVLTRCAGNKLRASEVLGISRSTLYRMLDAPPGEPSFRQ